MYYTPAVVIPGRIAHINLDHAKALAKLDGTYVEDSDGKIIEDYRSA